MKTKDAIACVDGEYYGPDYLMAINNINLLAQAEEREEAESPYRRFEITFIISLPFVFLSNFLILHLADVVVEGDPNVNVWENHGPFLVLNTLMISSIVSFREAGKVKGMKISRKEDLKERNLYLSYTYKL